MVKSAVTYFAGPWAGEFGWELFMWQGWLRKQAKELDASIVVCSHPGHDALYEDFMDDFIPFRPSGGRPDCMYLRGLAKDAFKDMVPTGTNWLNPQEVNDTCGYYPTKVGGVEGQRGSGVPVLPSQQEFIVFGEKKEKKYDILIHARSRVFADSRNWPSNSWLELLSKIPHTWTVGWIGTKEEAWAPTHAAYDLRGVSLSSLIEAMRSSYIVVGPSSGPIHLASLCSTPHIVWSGAYRDRCRYVEAWNPHSTSVSFINTWQPEVDKVYQELMHRLG